MAFGERGSVSSETLSANRVVFSDVVEEERALTQIPLEDAEKGKKKKVPRRILHFSDGIMEEYSTDEEDEAEEPQPPPVDTTTLDWLPWLWFYTVLIGTKSLAAADFCGEKLAWFFGITSPKYQSAIDEYYRLKEEEEEERKQEELDEKEAADREVAGLADMEEGERGQDDWTDSLSAEDRTSKLPQVSVISSNT